MGRTGSALDNAISKSFVPTLKCELVHRRHFPSREAARSAIFEYLEAFYNRRRLHSSLGYMSPESYEYLGMKEVAVAQWKSVCQTDAIPALRERMSLRIEYSDVRIVSISPIPKRSPDHALGK